MKRTAGIVLAFCAPVAYAHHGFGTFDMTKEIEITGTVTNLAFVNPHSWLYLDVTGGDGKSVPMRCEMLGHDGAPLGLDAGDVPGRRAGDDQGFSRPQ